MEYVLKYVDSGPHPGEHWFWRDGRRNHGHNSRGQAFVRWKVRPSAASRYFTHGEFTVARLLLAARRPVPAGARVHNLCGLSQCVNPDHWRVRPPCVFWRVDVRPDGAWQLARVRTGTPAKKDVTVHVSFEGTVHVAVVPPMSVQSPFDWPRAACGLLLRPEECVVVNDLVTCNGGC